MKSSTAWAYCWLSSSIRPFKYAAWASKGLELPAAPEAAVEGLSLTWDLARLSMHAAEAKRAVTLGVPAPTAPAPISKLLRGFSEALWEKMVAIEEHLEWVTAEAGVLTVAGLSAEKIVAALSGQAVVFSEVTAHRATLEDAYLELTKDAVDYRAAPAAEAAR